MLFNRAKFFLLLIGCLLPAAVTPLCAQYQVESWTTDNGLPQNTVVSILQTDDGYLWLTTLDGLVRFDGVRFTVFNKNNTKGIEGNRFTQMIVDRQGDLWVGTEENGVIRVHEGVFQTFDIGESLEKKSVRSLVLNNAGEVVALTARDNFRWDGERFVSYVPSGGETRDGLALWSKNGVFKYLKSETLPSYKDKQISSYFPPGAVPEIEVNKFFEDRRGRLWMGTKNSGLLVLENEKLTAFTVNDGLPSNQVNPQLEDRDGNLWAISRKGVVIISSEGKVSTLTTEQGLSDDNVISIYEDREGNIWIGTLFHGLNRLNKQSIAFYSKKDGLTADLVRQIYQDREGDIWIGGLNLTLWRDNRFIPVPGREKLVSQETTAIDEDHAGRLWFAHWGGAFYYENGEFTDFSKKLGIGQAIFDIHEDRAGALWFASDAGLFRFQNDTTTHITTAEGLVGNSVKVIHESPDGTLWFGTYEGLSRFKDGVFTSLTTGDGLSSNRVRSLYEDSDGVLWIGSYDGGLTRLKDGRLTRYTSGEGLFNDGVFQILEDDHGWFWMSCNRGIYRVAKEQLNDFADGRVSRVESIAYGKADGLLETECNGGQQPSGIKTRDGRLLFPTQHGVAVIDPDSIKTNPIAPPVLVESVSLNGIVAPVSDTEIVISPNIENLEIAYTGLSFIKPEQVHFRYKLSGLDSDWVESGARRTAYYSHLPPGEYVFTVVAANSDGVWNTNGASVRVHVVPPFYRTRWFLLVSLAAVSAAMFFLYRQRVVRLEQAHKAQEEFSRRLFASQEQERQRIAAELHDSIGQSLLIIKNRAFLALSELEEPEVVREQLEELSESATGAIEECREISYNLRPYQINRFGLTKTLKAIFRRISEVSKTETTINVDSIDDVFSGEAETNIYRVVQENVNNIIKHSHATEALFVIKRQGSSVEILIQDNGRGFDKNSVNANGSGRSGFGLIGITERVRMLGGDYHVESQPEQGTSIKIKLTISSTNERN